jgi:2,3-bisphosphoglycerate-dependent phosphoglycerate mutase
LTDVGIEQAEGAALLMKEKGFNFDLAYSSELIRAYKSAEVVLDVMNSTGSSAPMEPRKVWQLNERQYVYIVMK